MFFQYLISHTQLVIHYQFNWFFSIHENIFVSKDLNIDFLDPKIDTNKHFSNFRDIYKLTDLLKFTICFKWPKGTLLNNLLTNKTIKDTFIY